MNLKKPTKIIEKGIRVLVTTGGGRRGGELDEGNQKVKTRDFPGGPVAKTPSSHARGLGSIPGQGTRSHMPKLTPREAQKERKKNKNFFYKGTNFQL